MPTAYTSCITPDSGVTFEQFALRCAKNFAAFNRDESLDAPVPDAFEPSPWYATKLAEREQELREVGKLSDQECADRSNSEFLQQDAARLQRQRHREAQRAAYQGILDQVRAWEPPTARHVGLKAFMVQQLVDCIAFDCGGEQYEPRVEHLSPHRWREREEGRLVKECARLREDAAKDEARAKDCTAWLRELRQSLAPAPVNLAAPKSAGGVS